MKLIDKDAVVAEIKSRIKEIDEIGTYLSPKGILTNLLCHINTLEVKEVDLQSEIDRVWDNTSDKFSEDGWKEFEDIAKHFFELGMQVSSKAQKGE